MAFIGVVLRALMALSGRNVITAGVQIDWLVTRLQHAEMRGTQGKYGTERVPPEFGRDSLLLSAIGGRPVRAGFLGIATCAHKQRAPA